MKYYTLEIFGFKTQAPRWALTLFSLILIATAALFLFRTTWLEPERRVISLEDANKQLTAEVEEYGIHAMEEPEKHELFEEEDGKLILRVFKDHCVLIQRQTIKGTRTKLVPDLARGLQTASRQIFPSWDFLPVLEASQGNACQRGCLNPHPGAFKWWYGERKGEWVEVWRQWPEGCTHVQMFHPPSGSWDSNQDGTPRVRWTCCVH